MEIEVKTYTEIFIICGNTSYKSVSYTIGANPPKWALYGKRHNAVLRKFKSGFVYEVDEYFFHPEMVRTTSWAQEFENL